MKLPGVSSWRFTLSYFVFAALSAGVMSAGLVLLLLSDLYRQKDEAWERTRQNLLFKARLMSDQATRTLENVDLILFGLADELGRARRLPDREKAVALLKRRLLFQPQATNLALYGANGALVADARNLDAKDSAVDQTFFKLHSADGVPFFFDGPQPKRNDKTGRLSLRLSRLIADEKDGFLGVLMAEIDPAFFNHFYREEDLKANDLVALIGERGQIMASENPDALPLGADIAKSTFFDGGVLERMPVGGLNLGEGAGWFVASNQLANFPMRVVIIQSQDAILAPWRHTAKETYWIIAGIAATYLGALGAIGFILVNRQRAEQALKASETQLRTIYDNTDTGILRLSEDGRIIAHNKAFAQMMGAQEDGLVGLLFQDMTDLEDMSASLDRFQGLRQGEFDRYSLEKRYCRMNDGAPVWTKVSAVRVLSDDAKPMIFAMVEDITEMRRSKDMIEALLKRSQALINAVGEGILGLDSSGRVAFVNPAAEKLLGFAAKDMIGQQGHQLLHHRHGGDADHQEPDCPILAVLADGVPRQINSDTFRTKGGTTIPIEYVATPLMSNAGIEGAVIAFRDISRRLKAEEEIKRSNAELEQFAYAVSHDLQEPLRMVASYVQLLSRRYQGQLDEDADTFIGFAVDGAKRMQQMITDLLDYSRVQRKGNPMAPVKLEEPLNAALKNLDLAIQESQAEIKIETDLPTVTADAAQISRLFQNLIGNALKYRDKQRKTEIVVSSKIEGGHCVVAIKDNGIGIDPQYFERVFQIFQRLHARQDYPGTGIGLAICRRIVERHGGKIWVDSQPGVGSTFFFHLPLSERAS